MNIKNSTILTWKWEDITMSVDMEAEIAELASRFSPSMLCISLHWVHKSFDDAELQNKIKECQYYLEKKGIRLIVETCPRNEAAGFYQAYPEESVAYLAHYETLTLDENGFGEKELPVETIAHYWRFSPDYGIEKIYSAVCFTPGTKYMTYEPDSLRPLQDVSLKHCGDFNRITVRAGKENAGKTAYVSLLTRQPIPDLASDRLPDYFRKMAGILKNTSPAIGGTFSDEWGYDVILKISEPNPYDDNNLFIRHLSVSDAFAAKYAAQFPGCSLEEDFFHLQYAPADNPALRIAAVNRYFTVYRSITEKNDRDMYEITKEFFGDDAFYGVHPTWWGSVDSLNFEFFKNGFYWWNAKRDIAQTDEMVIMPIRTALSHKWGSSIFYNMWYSMGTRKIETYYHDTWNSVRFGGRTHHHSYRCPNEPVVLELAGEGLLESLEEMEKKVRIIDNLQKTAADCRVLVLFGMEAVSNWALSLGNDEKRVLTPPWAPQNPKLDAVLNTANALFDFRLCDLVPTNEITSGSLYIQENGLPCYGTQSYDAVLLFYPECMTPQCYAFLDALDKSRLIVCGSASLYADGTALSDKDAALLQKAYKRYPSLPEASLLDADLQALSVAANRTQSGCALQNGDWIFTAVGEKATGNRLHVKECVNGCDIAFEGDDFLYLDCSGQEMIPHHGGGQFTCKKSC